MQAVEFVPGIIVELDELFRQALSWATRPAVICGAAFPFVAAACNLAAGVSRVAARKSDMARRGETDMAADLFRG